MLHTQVLFGDGELKNAIQNEVRKTCTGLWNGLIRDFKGKFAEPPITRTYRSLLYLPSSWYKYTVGEGVATTRNCLVVPHKSHLQGQQPTDKWERFYKPWYCLPPHTEGPRDQAVVGCSSSLLGRKWQPKYCKAHPSRPWSLAQSNAKCSPNESLGNTYSKGLLMIELKGDYYIRIKSWHVHVPKFFGHKIWPQLEAWKSNPTLRFYKEDLYSDLVAQNSRTSRVYITIRVANPGGVNTSIARW